MCGTRGYETGLRLIRDLKNKVVGLFCSDYWKAYEKLLLDYWHIQSKAETFTVEGYNSILRHFLARLMRRTKCYSKCDKMLELSLKLLKRNNQLHILD